MDFTGFFIVLCAAFFYTIASQKGPDVNVGGIDGKSVRLDCGLPVSSPPVVRWIDYVHTSNPDPIEIFSSRDNEARTVNRDHKNAANFVVGPDYSLTISNLLRDDDPGNYVCISEVSGKEQRRSYQLTVGALPECQGEVKNLREGSTTTLSCRSDYSGNRVSLQWLRGSDEIDSEDDFDVGVALRNLRLIATYKDDRQKYTCRMTIGDMVEECSLTLSVKHLTRDLELTPDRDTLYVGEELTCTASGNPVPIISLTPLSSGGRSGDGWRSIVVEPEWLGQEIDICCDSSNTLDGKTEIIRTNRTIRVVRPPEEAAASYAVSTPLIVGVIIAVLILVLIVIIIIIVVIKKRNQKPPKGSKPLPTKEEISQSQYGQPV